MRQDRRLRCRSQDAQHAPRAERARNPRVRFFSALARSRTTCSCRCRFSFILVGLCFIVLEAMTARTSSRTRATCSVELWPPRRPRTLLVGLFGPAAPELTPPPDERAWRAHSRPGLLPARAHASSDAAAAVMLRGPRRSSVSDALRRRGPPSSRSCLPSSPSTCGRSMRAALSARLWRHPA